MGNTVKASLTLVVRAVLAGAGSGYPLHASCRIQYTFGRSCESAKAALANQMRVWEGTDNCPNGGQKCLYHYVSETDRTLVGIHETPIMHYLDDMTYTFVPTSDTTCSVEVSSIETHFPLTLNY